MDKSVNGHGKSGNGKGGHSVSLTRAYQPQSVCHHATGEMDQRCFQCNKPVCEQCSYPLPHDHQLCADCFGSLSDKRRGPEDDNYNFLSHLHESPITLAFAIAMVVAYVVTTFPGFLEVQEWASLTFGLNAQQLIVDKAFWRLITFVFIHHDVSHLFLNLFNILIFGHFTEKIAGPRVVTAWAVASLLGCVILGLVFSPMHTYFIGASGIGYGLTIIYIILAGKVELARGLQHVGKTFQSLIGFAVIILLVNLFAEPEVAVSGHLGGALAGLLCALAYPMKRPFARRDAWALVIVLLGLTVALAGAIIYLARGI